MGMTDWISSANVSCTTMYPPAAIGFARTGSIRRRRASAPGVD